MSFTLLFSNITIYLFPLLYLYQYNNILICRLELNNILTLKEKLGIICKQIHLNVQGKTVEVLSFFSTFCMFKTSASYCESKKIIVE